MITRYKLIILALVLTTIPISSLFSAENGDKPNILIILADDMGWIDAGCYGNADVKTPNIDRLATEGLLFNQAFTATAMCAPTRQQLYTGVFPVRNGAFPNHSKVKEGTRSMVHHLRQLGYRVGLKGKKHFGPRESFPFDSPKGLVDYMKADGPFCLVFASGHPHPKWPEVKGYDPAKIKVPPCLVDNAETRAALCRYYTAVTLFDDEVGQCLKALDESGKANETLVIVTSEQGPDFPFGKWTCYDYGLKTQFIARWPEVVKGGGTTDAMVQYVDVVPTLVEMAGGDPLKADTGLGAGFDGRSFLKVLKGEADQHHEVVYGVHTTHGINMGKPYPIRSIRNDRYKYILNPGSDSRFQNLITEKNYEDFWESWVRDAENSENAAKLVERYQSRPEVEFYDIVNDPFELNNLSGKVEYRKQMEDMRKQLNEWMEQQGDQGLETEMQAHAHKSMK